MEHNAQVTRLGLEIIEAAKKRNIILRLCGGAAVWIHCANRRDLFSVHGRKIADLDFVSTMKQRNEVQQLFDEFGFQVDTQIAAIPELRRSIFYRVKEGRVECRSDVHYDRMEYCHVIELEDRLTADYPTIPLAELLLSKLQIRQLSARDAQDLQALLLEHETGCGDKETINLAAVMGHCSKDWGLWKTTVDSIGRLRRMGALSPTDAELLSVRLNGLEQVLRESPKTWAWKIRGWVAGVAPWIRWYEEVDDVAPPSNLR